MTTTYFILLAYVTNKIDLAYIQANYNKNFTINPRHNRMTINGDLGWC